MPSNAAASKAESDVPEEEREEVTLPDPDFDEAEYMTEEVEKGKLAVMNTGYGIFLAAIAAIVEPLFGVTWKVGWFVLLAGVAFVRQLYRLGGVESHDWGAKEWLGAAVTLFFTFLAFWYIFSNPPFV